MNIFEELKSLEKLIDDSGSLIPGKGLDKPRAIEIINQVIASLPTELDEAGMVTRQKEAIIDQADKEAARIRNYADEEASTMREIAKRDAAGIIGDDGTSPINWRRVHRLPDHVRFVHEPHIRYLSANPEHIKGETDGVSTGPSAVCSTCHGNVASMEKVYQVEPLKMRQCVDCHRDNEAPTDCATCHH